jgi:hypothetical protein
MKRFAFLHRPRRFLINVSFIAISLAKCYLNKVLECGVVANRHLRGVPRFNRFAFRHQLKQFVLDVSRNAGPFRRAGSNPDREFRISARGHLISVSHFDRFVSLHQLEQSIRRIPTAWTGVDDSFGPRLPFAAIDIGTALERLRHFCFSAIGIAPRRLIMICQVISQNWRPQQSK